MSSFYVAVVGPGENASPEALADATDVARLIAERGWILLCGGRAQGVMAAAARAATAAGGIAVGVLPGVDRSAAAPELTVALPTGLGEARNAVLASCADAVIGCGMNPGTASELTLALRARKPTVLVRLTHEAAAFFASIAGSAPICAASTPAEAVEWVAARFAASTGSAPRQPPM